MRRRSIPLRIDEYVCSKIQNALQYSMRTFLELSVQLKLTLVSIRGFNRVEFVLFLGQEVSFLRLQQTSTKLNQNEICLQAAKTQKIRQTSPSHINNILVQIPHSEATERSRGTNKITLPIIPITWYETTMNIGQYIHTTVRTAFRSA